MSSKRKTNPNGIIVDRLTDLIEAYTSLADSNPLRTNDASLDTGHEKTSRRDKTFAYLFSTFAQMVWNQLNGQLRAADGRTFDNARTWLENANKRMTGVIQSKYDPNQSEEENKQRLMFDTDFLVAHHYVAQNEAKVEALSEILGVCTSVYFNLTDEAWQPRRDERTTPKKVELTDEQKAAAMASMEIAMKRLAAR